MLSKSAFLMTIVAVLSLPTFAKSQSASLGPHLGILKSENADDRNLLVGATLRLKLLPALGAEGNIGYRQEKFGDGAVTVKDWPVTVTGLLYPLPMLYGGVGAGWYNRTTDYSTLYNQSGFDDETSQEFGWHLAAGIEIPASPSVRLFGDVRYVFLDYKFKELPDAVLDGDNSDFYSVSFGLLFGI